MNESGALGTMHAFSMWDEPWSICMTLEKTDISDECCGTAALRFDLAPILQLHLGLISLQWRQCLVFSTFLLERVFEP